MSTVSGTVSASQAVGDLRKAKRPLFRIDPEDEQFAAVERGRVLIGAVSHIEWGDALDADNRRGLIEPSARKGSGARNIDVRRRNEEEVGVQALLDDGRRVEYGVVKADLHKNQHDRESDGRHPQKEAHLAVDEVLPPEIGAHAHY